MFGRNKNKDGPISPPPKGSWEFTFQSELEAAVAKRRKGLNKDAGSKNPRKTSGQENCPGGLSPSSISSLSPATTPPSTTPSPVFLCSTGFQYSPPKEVIEGKNITKCLTIHTATEYPDGLNPCDKASTVNGATKGESDFNPRQSLALDQRSGRGVLTMISKFNTIAETKPQEIHKPSKLANELTRQGSLKEKATSTTMASELTRNRSLRG